MAEEQQPKEPEVESSEALLPSEGLSEEFDPSSIPETIPLLPFRDAILYPFAVVPLAFNDPPLIAAVDEAMRGSRIVGVIGLTDGGATEDETAPTLRRDQLRDVGTVAVIHRLVKHPEAGMRLLVQGVSRFRIVELVKTELFVEASISVLPETSGEHGDRVEAMLREGYELAGKVISESSYMPDELRHAVRQLENPNQFAYMIASMVKLDPAEQQSVLESDDAEEKLDIVLAALRRELNVLQIGGEIKSQVDEELEKKQREYYLREQLRTIREELGEVGDEEDEIDRIRECLRAQEVPDHVMKAGEEQLERLTNIPAASPEYSLILGYLDWLCDVPWTRSTEDRLDLDHARQVLDEDHYDLREIKDRILEYLAVRKLKDEMKGPILCFVGPPGVGKTSLGRSIARALGREFVRMSLGGMSDEAEIRGHRRTYVGAMPGRIIQSLKRAGTNNPVFMLDEVDKVGADFRGDPSSALLEVLDPEQNNTFRDNYLDLAFDLSSVLFIATANVLQTIQPALADRMEIIRLAGYTDREKLHIAQQYLVPRQLGENGLGEEHLEIEEGALHRIITNYTQEAGVRGLEREIAKVCRKVAAQVANGSNEKVKVTPDDIPTFLGPKKAFHEVARRVATPGVATGLAWTAVGGEILFVEATTMPGGKGLTLTGKLGSVMQESVQAALGYIRSHTAELGLEERFFDDIDLHLHVPSGAVPKDGPSAGVTMATAIASAVSGRKVRPEVAMTGEITLTGQVLPVGGIKEKLVAARRSEIKTVIVPEQNRQHVEDVEPELLEGLSFVYAETISDVLEAALLEAEPEQPTPDEQASVEPAAVS